MLHQLNILICCANPHATTFSYRTISWFEIKEFFNLIIFVGWFVICQTSVLFQCELEYRHCFHLSFLPDRQISQQGGLSYDKVSHGLGSGEGVIPAFTQFLCLS